MKMKTRWFILSALSALFVAVATPLLHAQTCTTTVNEATSPEVFTGINTTETGFTSYFWAWGSDDRDQDGTSADLTDTTSGIAVNTGIVWANVPGCTLPNPQTTALLVEAQTTNSGGKFALCVGTQNNAQNVDLDLVQSNAGNAQSAAETIAQITISRAATGNDGVPYVDYSLRWLAPTSSSWAVNDVEDDVLAGYAIYYRTDGPSNTGDKTGWTRLTAQPSQTTPYIANDRSANNTTDGYLPSSQLSCIVRVRGSDTYYFALALRFDGTEAPTGVDREAADSAVETTYVGPSSPGSVGPLEVKLAYFKAKPISRDRVLVTWRTESESELAGFVLKRRNPPKGEWAQVALVRPQGQAGAGADYSYTDTVKWDRSTKYRLEVVGASGSVEATAEASLED